MSNHLPFVQPGALLQAMAGQAEWPHRIYNQYWDLAQSSSFKAQVLPLPKPV